MEKQHIVRRAIIMAAGVGMLLQPLTVETPKPLVRVNGFIKDATKYMKERKLDERKEL